MFVVQSEKENILKLCKSFSDEKTPQALVFIETKKDVNRKDLNPADQCSLALMNQSTIARKRTLKLVSKVVQLTLNKLVREARICVCESVRVMRRVLELSFPNFISLLLSSSFTSQRISKIR